MRLRHLIVVSLFSAGGLAACGKSAPAPTEPAPAPAKAEPAPAEPAAAEPAAAEPAAAEPAAAEAPKELVAGDAAPDVVFHLQDGAEKKLADFAGKPVLVYFYPKDDTPGCTAEAQGLRDRWTDLEAAGVAVVGVSLQDADSHKAFIDKHDLPFPLAVDDGTLAKAFGVPVRGEYAARQSFLVGPDGKLVKVWRQVDPGAHAAEVLAAAPKAAPADAP